MPREDPASVDFRTCPRANFSSSQATLVADGAKKVVFDYCKTGKNGSDYLKARWRGLAETDPLRLEFDELARRDVAAAAADELPVDRLQRVPDPGLVNLPTIWPRMRFPVRVTTPEASRDEGFFPRPGTRSRSAACATPTAPSSASSRAASAAAPDVSSDWRPSRPRRASARDSTPSTRRLGRAKLPRALVLRLLRLGPVRRAARGVPEPAQGPGDGPARTRSRVLGFEPSDRRVVSRRSRSTSRRCSGPRLPAHGAHHWIVAPLVGRRQRHGDAPRARASAAASCSRNASREPARERGSRSRAVFFS